MEFYDIGEDSKAFPGEYLFHVPEQKIVLCGAFIRSENKIKALSEGKMIIDEIKNFRKIKPSLSERKKQKFSKCKGCGK